MSNTANILSLGAAPVSSSGVEFVAKAQTQAANSGGGSITLDISGLSLSTGDLMVVNLVQSMSLNYTGSMSMTTSGFTTLATEYGNDTSDTGLKVFYKNYASETSLVGAVINSTSFGVAMQLMVFRGHNTVTLDASGALSNRDYIDWPTASSLNSGEMLVFAGGVGDRYTYTTTYPSPTDLDDTQFTSVNESYDIYAGMGYKAITTETSFTAADWDWNLYTGTRQAAAYAQVKIAP